MENLKAANCYKQVIFFLLFLSCIIVVPSYGQSPFSPSDITGLRLWLSADSGITVDGSSNVSQWKDISGNNNNFAQATAANRPAYVNNNLLKADALHFNGSSQELIDSTFLNGTTFPASSVSMFLVWGLNGTANQYGLVSTRKSGSGYWRYGGDGNGYLQNFRNGRLNGYPPNMPNTGNYYSSLIVSPTDYIFYLNGISKGTQAPDWGYGTDFLIGRDEVSNYLNGEIAEILIYNTALNDSLRNLVETYLHNKYAPPLNLGPDRTSICPVTLDPGSRYTSYLWSTGETTQAITVNTSNTYWVKVKDIFGFVSRDTVKITYPANLSPFPGNTTTICYGASVKWDTHLDKTKYTFHWQDNSTDSVLTITQAGQYSVTVTDAFSCTRASATLTVTVDNFSQIASLGPDTSICKGASMGLISGFNQATSYLWSTGATTAFISVSSAGAYSVITKSAHGCVAKDTIVVGIKGVAPTVNFSAPPVCFGNITLFKDSTVVPFPDSIASWNWNFGDASASALSNPTHSYSLAGTYTATLTVVSDSGCISAAQKPVKVKPLPSAAFTHMSAIINYATQFTDASSISGDSIVSWTWNFGDPLSGSNNVSNLKNPVHVFNALGNYSVQLTSVSSFGCVNTIISIVPVTVFIPTSIPGLRLWLSADSGITVDGSNNVTQWKDISGNNNNFAQAIAAKRPAYVNNNLLKADALHFNGSSQELIDSTFLNGTTFPASSVSMFLVWGLNGTANQYGLVSTRKNGTGYWRYVVDGNGYLQSFRNGRLNGYPPSMPNTGNYYSSLVISPTEYTFYSNGISKGMQAPDWGYGTDFLIGRDEVSNYLNGEIAEILIYNTALSDSLRNLVETYLHNKYAPPLNLGPDRTSICPVTLDAGSRYKYYLWSTGDITQVITVNASGVYWVTVTDIFGSRSTDTIKITYPANLSPFPGNTTTICYGASVKWDTHLDRTKYTFHWQDNSTDSVLAITQAGQYSVTVTDAFSCTRASATLTVTVDNFSQTASLGPDISMCSGASIALVSGAGQATAYLWSTGATTPSIVISTPGTSKYSLWVQNVRGCVAKDTITVNVKGVAPVADFLVNTACKGDKTPFSDLTTVPPPDNIASWSWNFGDGGTSTIQNPSHTYPASGTYSASLRVVSDSGCSAMILKPIVVNPNPNAKFNITSSPECTGTSTQFMDVSTISSGSMVGWNWNFGDGSSSLLKNPSHTYTSAATYTVQLIVTSALGCKDTIVPVIAVAQSPSALFLSDTVCTGSPTVFKDKSSGIINNWLWSFGDGSNSTIKNATHTYTLGGTYNTSLLVTASNGCMNSAAGVAVVNYLPLPGFKGNSACLHSPLQLTDISTVTGSTVNQWSWQFGSAGSSTLQNPLPVYSLPGTYSVSLTVTSAQGCFATATQTVSVRPLPVSSFSLTPAYCYPQQTVNFSGFSAAGTMYHWFFGDGGKDSVRNPAHAYQDTGTYSILLVTQNSFGCIDSSIQHISIDIPVLDIQLSDIFAVKSSNSVQVSAFLKNTGTLDVTAVELSAYLDDGTPIHEFWTGLVRPDSLITYPFHSSFELENNAHSIACVEVKKVNGQNDNVASNNKKCKAITDEFIVLNPFPNPTDADICFLFITPDVSNVKAQVFDAEGRLVANPFDGTPSRGLNQITFSTIKLEKGIYVLKLYYKDKVATKMFMKK